MSVISSTYSGRRAMPITYEYFLEHADEWSEEVLVGIHETIFTYKMHFGESVHFSHINQKFTVHIWVGKPAIVLTNLFQIDMLKKYFEAEELEDFNKYAEIICQS